MDCSKCGYALSAFEKDCPRCRRVAAEEFARSPASVWPPAVGPQVAAAPQPAPPPLPQFQPKELDNSSGEERGGPPEIEDLHWNWGAFFCGWLWCFFHRAPGLGSGIIAAGLFLTAFNVLILPAGYALPSELMALVVFGLCCYLGMTGHRTAWERRRFLGGVPQYFAVQRAWAVGGAAAFGVTLAFTVTFGLLFLAAFRAYEARRQAVPAAPVAVTPAAPAPIVLRPRVPDPAPMPLLTPRGMNGSSPGDFQRHFNPGYRGPGYLNPDSQNRDASGPEPRTNFAPGAPQQSAPPVLPRFPADSPPAPPAASEAAPYQAPPPPPSPVPSTQAPPPVPSPAPGPSQALPTTGPGQ